MEWTERQIIETLRLIEDSDYDEVKLETQDFKLHVRKTGAPAAAAGTAMPRAAAPEMPMRAPSVAGANEAVAPSNRAERPQ